MSMIQNLFDRQERRRAAQEKYFDDFREKTQQSYTQHDPSTGEQTKTCYRCKQAKPITKFNKCWSNKDRLHSYCKTCCKEYRDELRSLDEQVITKTCSRCKDPKKLSEFWRHKGNKDGLQYTCKDCRRQYDRDRYAERQAQIREYVEEKRELIARVENQPIVLYSDDFLVNALIITNVGWCATLLALLWATS